MGNIKIKRQLLSEDYFVIKNAIYGDVKYEIYYISSPIQSIEIHCSITQIEDSINVTKNIDVDTINFLDIEGCAINETDSLLKMVRTLFEAKYNINMMLNIDKFRNNIKDDLYVQMSKLKTWF